MKNHKANTRFFPQPFLFLLQKERCRESKSCIFQNPEKRRWLLLKTMESWNIFLLRPTVVYDVHIYIFKNSTAVGLGCIFQQNAEIPEYSLGGKCVKYNLRKEERRIILCLDYRGVGLFIHT